MVAVVNRGSRSIVFPVYDFNVDGAITGASKSILIYGYHDKRAPEDSILINGGTARITYIDDADWEGIKSQYQHLSEFKYEVIYAMAKEKDAKLKAKELINDFSHLEQSHVYRKQQGYDIAEIEEVV